MHWMKVTSPLSSTSARRSAPAGAGRPESTAEAETRRERDAEIRAMLEAALEKLQEGVP
jgi:hypothetical protein